MGIQGNKAATTHEHDFLSLYADAKDSPLQSHADDFKPPPPPDSSQGLFLKTHDFLQPLETSSSGGADANARQQPHQLGTKQRAVPLPGGVGTFSIRPAPAVVKAEPPLVLWGQPASHPGGGRGQQHHHQWTLPFAGAGQVRPPLLQQPERKVRVGVGSGTMDSGSRSSGGAGFDDDDGLAARREVSSSLKVRVDRKGGSCSDGGTDQQPNTPRSKHSATEQRRRSKINDRFQILRELLPHSDQKRDKATFLLEVIEYIRFLQEKVQKHEATFPEWNQENAKILPWSKGQIQGDALPDTSQFMRNGSSPGFNFTGKLDDNHNMETSAAASGAQDQAETDQMASVSYRSVETPTNIANNATSQCQPKTGPSPVDGCAVNNEMLNNQQLTIDEGTISVSSQYSQELLNSLTQALQSSGIDLSQASISVQINLGKRAVKRPAAGISSNSKEPTETQPSSNYETGHQLTMSGGSSEVAPSHATKRHKPGSC